MPARIPNGYNDPDRQHIHIETTIDPSLVRPMDIRSEKVYRDLTAEERKGFPLATGVLDYFPDALMEIAHLSKVGNDQHNPGQPLHWDRAKSTDQDDALMRHFKDRGTRDKDGERHSAKVAWRALAALQLEIEADYQKEHKRKNPVCDHRKDTQGHCVFDCEASLPLNFPQA